MRLKADWFPYLHRFRASEAELIFDRFPPDSFVRALELGAGDGFQSRMIKAHAKSLVSTDYRRPPLDDDTIEIRALAAEDVAKAFGPGEFDLVYSSNMLEHVVDPGEVLRAVGLVMADDGITIHVMPNQLWKVCQMVLYVPNLVLTVFDDLFTARDGPVLVDRLRTVRDRAGPGHEPSEKNNPTVVRPSRSMMQKLLTPRPHGVSLTHRQELAAFSRRRWQAEFVDAGFEMVAVLSGPFSSGYGFGWDFLRRLLETRGVGSEYVYVAKKAGRASRFQPSFDEAK